MCEKEIVKNTKSFRYNRRLTESGAFVYLVGIKSAQSVNSSHFFSFATIVTSLLENNQFKMTWFQKQKHWNYAFKHN